MKKSFLITLLIVFLTKFSFSQTNFQLATNNFYYSVEDIKIFKDKKNKFFYIKKEDLGKGFENVKRIYGVNHGDTLFDVQKRNIITVNKMYFNDIKGNRFIVTLILDDNSTVYYFCKKRFLVSFKE